jgi:hypothetical protein
VIHPIDKYVGFSLLFRLSEKVSNNKWGALKMHTCSYCGSRVVKVTDYFYCDFCDMSLQVENVTKDGERKDQSIKNIPFEYDFNKTTKELMQLKTIELLYLLRFARQNRSDLYNQRIIGHKAR